MSPERLGPPPTDADVNFIAELPTSKIEAADVITALNEGRLAVYLEYQAQLYERADQDPSPQSRATLFVELAKVCHAAQEGLRKYDIRIPLWQRHLDAAYRDAFERRDEAMLGNITKLIESYGGRVPTDDDIEAMEAEERME